jgi:hypothetical protein
MTKTKGKYVPNSPENYNIITWLWVFGLSILGGTVRTLTNMKVGMKWIDVSRRWVIDIVVSAFVGVLTFFLCEFAGFDQTLTAALVGISAHMGTRAIVILEEIAYKKFVGNKEEKDCSKCERGCK